MRVKRSKVITLALVALFALVMVACSPAVQPATEKTQPTATKTATKQQEPEENAAPIKEKDQTEAEDDFYDAADSLGVDTDSVDKYSRKENAKIIDRYATEEVPDGMPLPVEWQDAGIDKNKPQTCTLLVECTSIYDNMDKLDMSKLEVLPDDGVIYQRQSAVFYPGESVFDVLHREMKNSKIHLEYKMAPVYNSNYIQGINNIYEYDCGELSGWIYAVNGWYPNYGSSRYALQDGDEITWRYTCDLGRDVNKG